MATTEIRRLKNTWERGDFPKHLVWLEIENLRGWEGQRVEFNFPLVAIVGENGAGKSTIIQSAAASYKHDTEKPYYASDFFPDTAWDSIEGITIRSSIKEGDNFHNTSVRKPTARWRGNESRRNRPVKYLDLRRIQPIYARTGYSKLTNRNLEEGAFKEFSDAQKTRFSTIVGRTYNTAKHSSANIDPDRQVPVVGWGTASYSGFHQGAGEATLADLVALEIPNYALVLIDEVETSLHPRAQRRLIRDLATIAREKKAQFILTTHSPYVLDELPMDARVYVFNSVGGKQVVHGVSTEFALSKMDDENHPELDFYVEDYDAKVLVEEIVAHAQPEILTRIDVVPYGSASVGVSLGTMKNQNRFTRPTLVALDGDQDPAQGCLILPGDDAPERVVFTELLQNGFPDVADTISRSHADLVDNSEIAVTLPDHHDWVKHVADNLIVGGRELWRAMCKSWVKNVLTQQQCEDFVRQISVELGNVA